MAYIRCEFLSLYTSTDCRVNRAMVRRLDAHPTLGAAPDTKSKVTVTSLIKSIDFEKGIIITQNNVYLFGE